MNTMRDVRSIRLEIAAATLENVFKECDRYDKAETGGRVIGHFTVQGGTLLVKARGVIEPGPNARRSSTSFFQDGDHQTKVFRRIEADDPTIEHLGNWHTHHVNGYPSLSSGDIATYRRTVNHHLHNLDFFYALLVTARRAGRSGLDRYAVRHYVLFRGDDGIYEVETRNIHVTPEASIWPRDAGSESARTEAVPVRAMDQRVLSYMYPSLQPWLSSRSGTLTWKGTLELVDGTEAKLRIVEVEGDEGRSYYLRVTPASAEATELYEVPFQSAGEAVHMLERRLNRAIYKSTIGSEC